MNPLKKMPAAARRLALAPLASCVTIHAGLLLGESPLFFPLQALILAPVLKHERLADAMASAKMLDRHYPKV
jgi:hypothetical protein